MKSIMWPAAAVLAATLCSGVVHASGPIAVYALVDKVTFEPDADKPERIRISGVFITSILDPVNSTAYSTPQRGYLYFRLPAGNQELVRREWEDLKSVAGKLQVVGFGSSWGANVRVWKSTGAVESPDDYPMGNGLVKIYSDNPRAKALLDYKDR
jgi:hypothetical protein